MKKYMNFKYENGECQVTYKIKGFALAIRGRGISETAKEMARLANEIYNTKFL